MIRRPPRSTRTDTLFPYTTLFRSHSCQGAGCTLILLISRVGLSPAGRPVPDTHGNRGRTNQGRSEEHTSELQSLMRISYAVFCLKKKKKTKQKQTHIPL